MVTADDADLVLAVRGGDQAAFGELFARWSDRCYDVARRIVHDDGIAAEVAQDVFLGAWQQLGTLRDPSAFGGWVLRSARNRALNRLEKERRSVSTADDSPVLATVAATDAPERHVEAAMTAIDHRELVAAATVVLGEREASVLDLHLRHGLSAAELAEELGVTTNNAHQLIFRTKKKLAGGIRAWVLVRGGRPSCASLGAALDDAGVTEFSRAAVGVIGEHLEGCDDCTRRQAAVLDPAALFAAAPVIAMPAALHTMVADGLRAEGVPADALPAPEAPTGSPATAPPGIGGPAEPPAPSEPPSHRRALLVLAAAIVVAVGVGVALWAGVGEESVTSSAPTTTSAVPASIVSTTSTVALPAPAPTPDAVFGQGSGSPTTETTTVSPAPGPTTTAPPLPAPTERPTVSLVPNPPTTTTQATPPPTTAPAAPRIDSFTATSADAPGGSCTAGQWATTLAWTTSAATSTRITATGEAPRNGLPADGSRVACRPTPSPPPGGWTLTATGPGGSVSRTV